MKKLSSLILMSAIMGLNLRNNFARSLSSSNDNKREKTKYDFLALERAKAKREKRLTRTENRLT